MLADHLIFRTRRSQETGTEEGNGWSFETWGAGDFGELRPYNRDHSGTTVILELRDPHLKDAKAYYSRLIEYLSSIVAWVPCKFAISSNLADVIVINASRGWFLNRQRLVQEEISRNVPEAFRDQATEAAQIELIEEELPEGFGRLRLCLPWFKSRIGPSFGYVFAHKDGSIPSCEQATNAFVPTGGTRYSWCGMAPDGAPNGLPSKNGPGSGFGGALVEVDFRSSTPGGPNISRSSLAVDPDVGTKITSHIEKRVSELKQSFLSVRISGDMRRINAALAGVQTPSDSPLQWPILSADQRYRIKPVTFPATDHSAFIVKHKGLSGCSVGGQPVTVCGALRINRGGRMVDFFEAAQLPSRCVPTRQFEFCPVWDAYAPANEHSKYGLVRLPSEWSDVLVCEMRDSVTPLLNVNHSLVRGCADDLGGLLNALDEPDDDDDDDDDEGERLVRDIRKATKSPESAQRWLLRAITHRYLVYSYWDRIVSRNSKDIVRIWSLAFGAHDEMTPVLRLHYRGGAREDEGDDSSYAAIEEVGTRGWKTYAADDPRYQARLSGGDSVILEASSGRSAEKRR